MTLLVVGCLKGTLSAHQTMILELDCALVNDGPEDLVIVVCKGVLRFYESHVTGYLHYQSPLLVHKYDALRSY